MSSTNERPTYSTTPDPGLDAPTVERVRGFELTVLEGPDRGLRRQFFDHCTIGRSRMCDFVLTDEMISACHCVLERERDTVRIRERQSTNGLFIRGIRVWDARLVSGVRFRIGATEIEFLRLEESRLWEPSPHRRFGSLVGRSLAMRTTFAELEFYAPFDYPIVLLGETGTGKSEVARSIHQASKRSGQFIRVDCTGLTREFVASDLFGHTKGAFTNANKQRVGAFQAAHQGTIFLDEVGDLEPAMQARLLLALDKGELQRLGDDYGTTLRFDVRVIAATNRELLDEVRAGRFRADLYYRLNKVVIRIPPLRERPEDLDELAREVLRREGCAAQDIDRFMTDEVLARLRSGTWRGNFREFEGYVCRCFHLRRLEPIDVRTVPPPPGPHFDMDIEKDLKSFKESVVALAEEHYLLSLLERYDWNVTRAARHAGIERTSMHKKMRYYGIKRDESATNAPESPGDHE